MAFRDPETEKTYKHAWYLAHREEIRQKKQQQYLASPEKERERSHGYYVANREQCLARQRGYTAAHRKENAARCRVYQAAHKEELRLKKQAAWLANQEENCRKGRESHMRNRESHLAKMREWQKANPGRTRALSKRFKRKHPEKGRLDSARRRARKRGLPDTFTLAERQFMLEYWQHACAICGNQDGFFWTLADDHWDALSSPTCPGTIAENMIPLCDGQGGCNTSKNNRGPKAWLLSRYTPAQTKRILKAIEAYFALVRARKEPSAAD